MTTQKTINTTTKIPGLPLAQPGTLIIETAITLHTRQAQKLVTGISTARGVTGLWSFASQVKRVWNAAANDDPYADLYLLKIYDALSNAQRYLHEQRQLLQQQLQQYAYLKVTSAHSATPLLLPLNFATPYGYFAAAVIGDFDEWARTFFTAKKIGLKLPQSYHDTMRSSLRTVLQGFNKTFHWKAFGIARIDAENNSDNFRAAQKVLGKLPLSVLTKQLRAPLAPFIKVPPPVTVADATETVVEINNPNSAATV